MSKYQNVARPFRFLRGVNVHPTQGLIDHVPTIRNQGTSETTLLSTNGINVAYPQLGPGGRIIVLALNDCVGHRLDVDNHLIQVVENGSDAGDFAWSYMNPSLLFIGGDDGKLSVWKKQETMKRIHQSQAHENRIHMISVHPTLPLVATTSIERWPDVKPSICVHSYDDDQLKLCLRVHLEDVVSSIQFHIDQPWMVVSCKNNSISIIHLKDGHVLMSSNQPHYGKRGNRSGFCGNSSFLYSIGFSQTSERELKCWDLKGLVNGDSLFPSAPVAHVVLDISPAILVPFYDEDTNVLYMYSRGERLIRMFEFSPKTFMMQTIDPWDAGSLHLDCSFLPKRFCDAKDIELSRMIRLLPNQSIDTVKFTMPRQRTEYFQDDIFPDTRDERVPLSSAKEFYSSGKIPNSSQAVRINMNPNSMLPLSKAPPVDNSTNQKKFLNHKNQFDEDQQRERMLKNLFNNAKDTNESSEDEKSDAEVADDEW